MSARSWTAPALCRFGNSREIDGSRSLLEHRSCPEAKALDIFLSSCALFLQTLRVPNHRISAALPNCQSIQHRLDPGNFMSPEQVGLPQRRQNGEERFSRPNFLSKTFEGVGQGMADRPSQATQSKGVEEGPHLMANANR